MARSISMAPFLASAAPLWASTAQGLTSTAGDFSLFIRIRLSTPIRTRLPKMMRIRIRSTVGELMTANRRLIQVREFSSNYIVLNCCIDFLFVVLDPGHTLLSIQWTGRDPNFCIWCVLWKRTVSGNQGFGSGSGSVGSVCFWAPGSVIILYRSGSGSGSFHQQANWIFFCENWCNVPSKSKKQKNLEKKLFLCVGISVSHWRKQQDPDPDPYQKVTDPQHWMIAVHYFISFVIGTGTCMCE